MPELREDLRAYFDRLAETAEQVTMKPNASRVPAHRRRGMPSGALVALAAAFLALVGIVVAISLLNGSDGTDPRPLATTPTPSAVPSTPIFAKRCGESLPFTPNLPNDFTGPLAGPAPGNPSPSASPDQLVVHWSSPTISAEYRWPADDNGAAGPGPLSEDLPPGGQVELHGGTTTGLTGPDASGTYDQVMYWYLAAPEGCRVMTTTVSGRDRASLESLVERLTQRPFVTADAALVIGDETVDDEPTVTPCRTPPGVSSPNQGGPTDANSPRFNSPAGALQHFVDDHLTLIPNGYIAHHLPDGSIVYGVKGPGLDYFVTVVHVRADGGRWWVDRWEASGC